MFSNHIKNNRDLCLFFRFLNEVEKENDIDLRCGRLASNFVFYLLAYFFIYKVVFAKILCCHCWRFLSTLLIRFRFDLIATFVPIACNSQSVSQSSTFCTTWLFFFCCCGFWRQNALKWSSIKLKVIIKFCLIKQSEREGEGVIDEEMHFL